MTSLSTSGGGDAAAAAAALERASILADAADDPALASCCVRDLEGQARAERVKARLAAADRVEARVRAAGVGAPPGAADEDEAALASIRSARLAQLQARAAEAAARSGRKGDGDGGLADLRSAKGLWRLVEGQGAAVSGGGDALPDAVPPLVAHLYVPGAPGGAGLDEVLAGLAAERAGGLRCVRVPASAAGLAAGVGLPSSSRGGIPVPVLVAFRGGAMVAKAPVAAFLSDGGGEAAVEEEAVAGWLRAAHMLEKMKKAGDSSSDDDEGEDDAADPCPECGRTYAHEHVRAVRVGGGAGSGGGDSSSEEEDE